MNDLSELTQNARNRTRAYWYVDGLVEVTIGALFSAFGIILLGIHLLPAGHPAAIAITLGFPLLFIGGGLLARNVVQSLKSRLTYPRTGFVSYATQRSPRRRWLAMGVGGAVTAVTILLVASGGPERQDWMPLFDGIVFGMLLLVIGSGVKRFYLLSALSFGTGLLLAMIGAGGNLGHGWFYTITGLALVISGVTTLVLYLRRHPAPEGDTL